MKQRHRWIVGLLALSSSALLPAAAWANTFYIAPTGNNNNDGSIGSPFATVQKAVTAASAGDTIYVRGGTYNLTSTISISKTGTVANPFKLWAYPGESPVFDFAGQSLGNRGFSFGSSADWWHVKGLTIQKAGSNGMITSGDNGIFEQLVLRNNRNSGFQLSGSASFNHVLNTDSYENYDPNGRGEDADGFAIKSENLGPGNIIEGARAWRNSDDGWDFWESRSNGVLVLNSWSADNGYDPDPGAGTLFNGDGNGFKLGHDSGSHIMANVLVVNNRNNGIDINGNGYIYSGDTPLIPNGNHVEIYNTVSHFNNGKNWRFDEEIAHILKNNVSLQSGSSDLFMTTVADEFNAWNPGVASVSTVDFVSTFFGGLQATLLRSPRQSDGSLPDLGGYLKLAPGSDLINAGTPISFVFNGVTYNLPYNGAAPDLGAFEFVPSSGVMGDYNNNDVVDAADYTVWRDTMAGGGSLLNDPTPESVSESDFTYWREHFGATSGGGAGSASVVPEPGTFGMMLVAAMLLVGLWRRRGL